MIRSARCFWVYESGAGVRLRRTLSPPARHAEPAPAGACHARRTRERRRPHSSRNLASPGFSCRHWATHHGTRVTKPRHPAASIADHGNPIVGEGATVGGCPAGMPGQAVCALPLAGVAHVKPKLTADAVVTGESTQADRRRRPTSGGPWCSRSVHARGLAPRPRSAEPWASRLLSTSIGARRFSACCGRQCVACCATPRWPAEARLSDAFPLFVLVNGGHRWSTP
jgi:hypothetical protein